MMIMFIQTIEGYVHKVDTHQQKLHLYEETGMCNLDLKDIVEIK